jgi:DNA-binding response OmpR family regulator
MKKQLLIIDDNPMMGGFLTQLFGKQYDTQWCSNAEEALGWLLKKNMPDLIISDYNLTGMSGLDFLNQLRNSGFYLDIPVVMLSGDSKSDKRIECLKSGASDFVMKPFNPTELELKVDKLIETQLSETA